MTNDSELTKGLKLNPVDAEFMDNITQATSSAHVEWDRFNSWETITIGVNPKPEKVAALVHLPYGKIAHFAASYGWKMGDKSYRVTLYENKEKYQNGEHTERHLMYQHQLTPWLKEKSNDHIE